MKTKLAIVFSGGGLNGAFQVGALRYISEKWSYLSENKTPLSFDIIAGVSAGALNGSLIAMNEFNLLQDIWVNQVGKNGTTEIYTSPFFETNHVDNSLRMKLDGIALKELVLNSVNLELSLFDKLELLVSKKKRKEIIDLVIDQISTSVKKHFSSLRSIADNTPLELKLKKYLNRGKIKNTIFNCGFVSLNSGTYHSVSHSDFSSNEDFVNGVLASTAIPMLWKPVDKVSFLKNSKPYTSYQNVDGGLMNVSPLGDVIKLIENDTEECTYKIIVVNCNSGFPKIEELQNKSVAQIVKRAIYDLTLTEVFNNDISHFLQINGILKQLKDCPSIESLQSPNNRKYKTFEIAVINPSSTIDLGNALVANQDLINQRMGFGYDSAKIIHSIF
jgi:NTE family protein